MEMKPVKYALKNAIGETSGIGATRPNGQKADPPNQARDASSSLFKR